MGETVRPLRPALLIHRFFTGGPRSDAGLAHFQDACHALGMDTPISEHAPARLDTAPTGQAPAPVRLAAGRRTRGPGVFQWHIRHIGDSLTATALLAPETTSATWHDLHTLWSRAHGDTPPDGHYGTALVYCALLPRRVTRARTFHTAQGLDALGAALTAPAPPPPTGHWCATRRGLRLWDHPPAPLPFRQGERHLMALAPLDREEDLYRWLWRDDDRDEPRLTSYLRNAAELHYQGAVLDRERPALHDLHTDLTRACDRLVQTLDDDARLEDLIAADRLLSASRLDRVGLTGALSAVSTMTETVLIARHNMDRSLADERTVCGTQGMVAADTRRHERTLRQLRAEHTYLTALKERAADVAATAAATIDQGLRRRQERLTLLQTCLLGALVTALAAMQSLGYKLPLDPQWRAPIVVTAAALSLILPWAVLYWSPQASSPGWNRTDAALFTLFGTALGWAAATAADLSGPWWTAAAAAAGAIIGLAAHGLRRLRARSRG